MQAEILKRNEDKMAKRLGETTVFAKKIVCAECGNYYSRNTWHSNDKYRKEVYFCVRKYDGDKICRTPTLSKEDLQRLFVKAANKVIINKKELIDNVKTMITVTCDTRKMKNNVVLLKSEINSIVEKTDAIIKENALKPIDEGLHRERYDEMVTLYNQKQAELDELEKEIVRKEANAIRLKKFLKDFKKTSKPITEFDDDMWLMLIDHVTAYTKEKIVFTFKGGMEVELPKKDQKKKRK